MPGYLNLALRLILLAGASCAAGQSAAAGETTIPLWRDASSRPDPASRYLQPRGTVVRRRPVQLETAALMALQLSLSHPARAAATGLRLELFDGMEITLAWRRSEPGHEGVLSWVGKVVGIEHSEAVLVLQEGIVQGNISWPGARYHLRYSGIDAPGEQHEIRQIDASQYPPAHPPVGPAIPPIPHSRPAVQADRPDAPAADDGSVIDVMVLYTPAAMSAAGGQSAMLALINLAVTETNMGYQNSGIAPRLRLVTTAEAYYTETVTATFINALNAVTATGDGEIDGIHALRDSSGADLVSLLIDEPGLSCGLGWLFNGDARYGFQVTNWDCATGNYSFGHEFGHNQGALHDWRVDSTPGYAHGYLRPDKGWRTVMAYNDADQCPGGYCATQNIWSNPYRSYNGDATGVPEGEPNPADNARQLNETAYAVANYRASASTPGRGDPPPPASAPGLAYQPLPPCRLADTRADSLGGAFDNGAIRFYAAWPEGVDLTEFGGSAVGCGIPADATAIHVNFTIVSPQAGGYLRSWPYDTAEPAATVHTWSPGFGTANAATVPICSQGTPGLNCDGHFHVKIYSAARTHLVMDVVGYYSPLQGP